MSHLRTPGGQGHLECCLPAPPTRNKSSPSNLVQTQFIAFSLLLISIFLSNICLFNFIIGSLSLLQVVHKRTFFYLEQLILRHNAHANCSNIVERRDGLDFFFQTAVTDQLPTSPNLLPIIQAKSSKRLEVGSGTSQPTRPISSLVVR